MKALQHKVFFFTGNQLQYSNKVHNVHQAYDIGILADFFSSLLYSRNGALIQGLTTSQAMQLAYFVNNKTGNMNMGYEFIGLHMYR